MILNLPIGRTLLGGDLGHNIGLVRPYKA